MISEKLELSGRGLFFTPVRVSPPHETQASTLIDAGGYYHFKVPGLQLLFAYGHSVAGQTETYAYHWGSTAPGKR